MGLIRNYRMKFDFVFSISAINGEGATHEEKGPSQHSRLFNEAGRSGHS
jgi:hypothetical protein